MAGAFNVFAKVDSSRLTAALKWRQEVVISKRTLRQQICTSALEVALNAQRYTPAVAQGTIDAELGVFITPRTNKRGRPIYSRKTRLFHSMRQKNNPFQKNALHQNAPLAALIINAQANYQSVYNANTNRRYYRAASPFKGKTRAAGRYAMTAAINRMIRHRHRSTHFLKSGWIEAIRTLAPLSVSRGRAALRTPPGGNEATWHNPKGFATVLDSGAAVAVTIENSIGTAGVNGPNFNEALWRHGAPALQRAIDEEAAAMVAYIQRKMAEQDAQATAMMR